MKRLVVLLALIAVSLSAAAWILTSPAKLAEAALAAPHTPNLENGRVLFTAANCSGCHMTVGQSDRARLGGGRQLKSPFGTFVVPNISPDPRHGIGSWSDVELINAVKRGVGRKGEHLYPSFPYPSYSLMTTGDVRDILAYIKTLPVDERANAPHDLAFPYAIRRSVGAWKLLYFRPREFVADEQRSPEWNRGRYLAEGAAHCVECHTPRNALGGLDRDKLYAGAPNLEAGGKFAVNITPHRSGIGDWSEQEIADFLSSGLNNCFNEPAGMAAVLASTTLLPANENAALATYIKSLSPKPDNGSRKAC